MVWHNLASCCSWHTNWSSEDATQRFSVYIQSSPFQLLTSCCRPSLAVLYPKSLRIWSSLLSNFNFSDSLAKVISICFLAWLYSNTPIVPSRSLFLTVLPVVTGVLPWSAKTSTYPNIVPVKTMFNEFRHKLTDWMKITYPLKPANWRRQYTVSQLAVWKSRLLWQLPWCMREGKCQSQPKM